MLIIMVVAMNRTTFSLEVFGERAANIIYNSRGYNQPYIEHLKRLLRKAIAEELTESQRDAVTGFYFFNKSVSEMALEKGVNKSTVSRNLKRGCERLALSMKYGLSPVYLDRE